MGNFHEFGSYVGKTFERLTVIGVLKRKSGVRAQWRCRCICKTVIVADAKNVRNGNTKSCGCLRDESCARFLREMNTTHGMSHRPEYRIWAGIKRRCFNRNDPGFKNYGGRGITMSKRWRGSFSAFFSDMGPRPSLLHDIERRNNDGNYEKSNCIWASARDQANNRRSNRFLALDGERHTVAEWSRLRGIRPGTLLMRLARGWDASRVLKESLHNRGWDKRRVKRVAKKKARSR